MKKKIKLKQIIKNLAELILKVKIIIPKLKIQTEEIQLQNFSKLYHKKDLNLEETEEEILDQVHYRKLLIEVTVEEIDLDFLGKRKVNLRI